MDPAKAKEIFNHLYADVSGSTLSLQGREAKGLTSKSFVYGEVTFDAFYKILNEMHPQPGETFCDLGSGTGKAVFMAYLLFQFSKTAGVELVETLYDAAIAVQKRFEKEFHPALAAELGDRKLAFYNADLLDVDISNVDVLFMNSTCFQEDLMAPLETKLESVKSGSRILVLSKPLKSTEFSLLKQEKEEFSWGQATCFYYTRN